MPSLCLRKSICIVCMELHDTCIGSQYNQSINLALMSLHSNKWMVWYSLDNTKFMWKNSLHVGSPHSFTHSVDIVYCPFKCAMFLIQFRHRLEPGDLLTMNNHRWLHGRERLQLNGGARRLIVSWCMRPLELSHCWKKTSVCHQILNMHDSYCTCVSCRTHPLAHNVFI